MQRSAHQRHKADQPPVLRFLADENTVDPVLWQKRIERRLKHDRVEEDVGLGESAGQRLKLRCNRLKVVGAGKMQDLRLCRHGIGTF